MSDDESPSNVIALPTRVRLVAANDEVANLSAAALPRPPHEDVVAILKKLLGRAERGEIMSIAYATVSGEGGVTTGWEYGAADFFHKGDCRGHDLVAAVSHLNFRILHGFNADSVSDDD